MTYKMTSLTFSRFLTCAVAGWMAFTSWSGALRADTAVPPRKPAVLFSCWTSAQISSDVANRLAREGFAVRTTPPASDPPKPLTWEEARHLSDGNRSISFTIPMDAELKLDKGKLEGHLFSNSRDGIAQTKGFKITKWQDKDRSPRSGCNWVAKFAAEATI